MQSIFPKLCTRGAFAACVYLTAGCGGSSSNLYDAPSGGSPAAHGGSGPASSSGGASPAAGASGMGTSGGASASAGTGAGGTSTIGNPSNAPCSPAKDVTGGSSGELGTMGAACLRVTADIAGWNCSNFDGRTVKVNGRTVMCGELPLPDKIDGAYYFDISAGMFEYASFYWF